MCIILNIRMINIIPCNTVLYMYGTCTLHMAATCSL